MAILKDARVALVRLASAIYDRFSELAGPPTVRTTGRIALEPGAPAIIPGGAEMLFNFRDTDPANLARLTEELKSLVARADQGPCRVMIAERQCSAPRVMDGRFQDVIEGAAQRHVPGLHTRMPSGAGRDAQVFAQCVLSAMLFVPSVGGISHHWSEDTRAEDTVLGFQVLADAAAKLLASN